MALLMGTLAFSQQKWPAQEDFHAVMSKTFHAMEDGNYEPIKSRSAELAAKAEAWKSSVYPSSISDKPAVRRGLRQLSKKAKALNKAIKKGAGDAEIKEKLTDMHDVFHTVTEKTGAGHHEEHH